MDYGIEAVGANVSISFVTDKEPTKEYIEKIEKLLESSKEEKSLLSYYLNVKFVRAEVFFGEEWYIVKEKIKRIIEKIKDIFSLHCPECGARTDIGVSYGGCKWKKDYLHYTKEKNLLI